MAGKDFALRATPAAAAVIEQLRGTARRSCAAFETELGSRGAHCRPARDTHAGYYPFGNLSLLDG